MRSASLGSLPALLVLLATSLADDWPQWLGPNRDSVWRENGIVQRFPAEGLKITWRAPVALGYAGPAVAQGRVYLMDYVPEAGEFKNNAGGREKLEGKERVLCLDAPSSGAIRPLPSGACSPETTGSWSASAWPRVSDQS